MTAQTVILPTERQVQRSILAMCGLCFPDVFITAIPNGAHLAGNERQRAMLMGSMKGDGLKVGFPDLLCLWNHGHGALIEVKRPKLGKLSDAQIVLHERLRKIGWPVFVITTTHGAFTILRHIGAPWSGIGWDG